MLTRHSILATHSDAAPLVIESQCCATRRPTPTAPPTSISKVCALPRCKQSYCLSAYGICSNRQVPAGATQQPSASTLHGMQGLHSFKMQTATSHVGQWRRRQDDYAELQRSRLSNQLCSLDGWCACAHLHSYERTTRWSQRLWMLTGDELGEGAGLHRRPAAGQEAHRHVAAAMAYTMM